MQEPSLSSSVEAKQSRVLYSAYVCGVLIS